MEYNIYCDESCHLQNDRQKAMVLGAVWCPKEGTREISTQLRELKEKYGLSKRFEIKWTKVSPSRIDFYQSILDYFFAQGDLRFRAVIIPDKSKLRRGEFKQSHDEWYYKMYFTLLSPVIKREHRYRIYLDYKDTKGSSKVAKLRDVLRRSLHDWSSNVILNIQTVKSEEVELIQLADFLLGIVSYANRQLDTSAAKLALVNKMGQLCGYPLINTTPKTVEKVNLFRWRAREA